MIIDCEPSQSFIEGGYRGPYIKIHSLVIEPLIEEWPPKSHKALFGMNNVTDVEMEKLVRNFAFRAFRRPVEDHEIEPYLSCCKKRTRFQIMLWKKGLKRWNLSFS